MSVRRSIIVLGAVTAAVASGAAVFVTAAAGSTAGSPRMAPQQVHTSIDYLAGYDAATGRVRVQDARWVPGGLDNGHFELLPRTRELPVASDVTARSAVALCSTRQPSADLKLDRNGDGTRPCSRSQLIAGLAAGHTAFASVGERDGRIVSVAERYTP